ncbi:hypothetical protein [Desulfosediminicola flagellatus]|uniref:hypothetical protein n=1 Tax=Desulfosediminicola flagellatus TaxID=2569541 RepID=UPI0010ADA288|nr:hypothetical protein [Desulfosediminicola flagellatus]
MMFAVVGERRKKHVQFSLVQSQGRLSSRSEVDGVCTVMRPILSVSWNSAGQKICFFHWVAFDRESFGREETIIRRKELVAIMPSINNLGLSGANKMLRNTIFSRCLKKKIR